MNERKYQKIFSASEFSQIKKFNLERRQERRWCWLKNGLKNSKAHFSLQFYKIQKSQLKFMKNRQNTKQVELCEFIEILTILWREKTRSVS